jgi:hypothetical protein
VRAGLPRDVAGARPVERVKFRCVRTARLPLFVAVLIATLGAACDSTVHVQGRILSPDGSPAGGYSVQMYATFDDGSHFRSTALTDAQGRYELEADVGAAGDDDRVKLYVDSPDQEHKLYLSVPARPGDNAIPDLQTWDDALSVKATPGAATHVSWSSVGEGIQPKYRLEVYEAEAAAIGKLTWTMDVKSSTSIDVPAEVSANRRVAFRLSAGDPVYTCTEDLCVQAFSRRVTSSPSR